MRCTHRHLANGVNVVERKLLLGKVPRQDAKVAVQAALFAAGAPRGWSADECDAFVAANFGLSELPGAFCFGTEAA